MLTYIYRPQTKSAKVMFSHVFVCPHVESLFTWWGSLSRGVSVHGVSVQGVSVQWGLCPGGLCPGGTPYGNTRAVRILIECILVKNCIQDCVLPGFRPLTTKTKTHRHWIPVRTTALLWFVMTPPHLMFSNIVLDGKLKPPVWRKNLHINQIHR